MICLRVVINRVNSGNFRNFSKTVTATLQYSEKRAFANSRCKLDLVEKGSLSFLYSIDFSRFIFTRSFQSYGNIQKHDILSFGNVQDLLNRWNDTKLAAASIIKLNIEPTLFTAVDPNVIHSPNSDMSALILGVNNSLIFRRFSLCQLCIFSSTLRNLSSWGEYEKNISTIISFHSAFFLSGRSCWRQILPYQQGDLFT